MISHLAPLVRFAVVVCLSWSTLAAHAGLKLHGLFTDNMVLQQGMRIPIWGWADDGEMITVEYRGQSVSTTAKNGKWMVRLSPLRPDLPAALTIVARKASANTDTVTLRNVVVGEVWVASGQSNMEWPMRASLEPEAAIARSANSMIRLFTVPKTKAAQPQDNVKAAWLECDPNSVSNFSAVAYYFAKDLQWNLGLPIGIIHSSWGGSPVEVWIREEILAANPEWKRDILEAADGQQARAREAMAQFEREEAEAKREGKPFTKRRPGMPWKPCELYNGMIAPLIPYAIKGAIWYQGESNAGRAHQYRKLFPAMIQNWREDWDQGDFTFLEVQLAPFMAIKPEPAESTWAELREAQLLATRVLPKVGMAVITDVGDEKDIHPKNKEVVGRRLALAARHIAYGEKIVWSGPTFKHMKVRDHEAVLSFDHVGSGLVSEQPVVRKSNEGQNPVRPTLTYVTETGLLNWPLLGFNICGEDGKWLPAEARIEDDKVIVSNVAVAKPVAVRYGWADYPLVNLYNREGLPASPFRTDDFPMITAPKTLEARK